MTGNASLAAQLEALAEKLSPRGPYSAEAFNEVFDGHDTMQAMVLAGDGESIFSQCMKDDAAFAVVEILNNLPAIITALRADQRCAELEAENARLRGDLEAIALEAERENGGWVHLRRVIGLHARAALGGPR